MYNKVYTAPLSPWLLGFLYRAQHNPHMQFSTCPLESSGRRYFLSLPGLGLLFSGPMVSLDTHLFPAG